MLKSNDFNGMHITSFNYYFTGQTGQLIMRSWHIAHKHFWAAMIDLESIITVLKPRWQIATKHTCTCLSPPKSCMVMYICVCLYSGVLM